MFFSVSVLALAKVSATTASSPSRNKNSVSFNKLKTRVDLPTCRGPISTITLPLLSLSFIFELKNLLMIDLILNKCINKNTIHQIKVLFGDCIHQIKVLFGEYNHQF